MEAHPWACLKGKGDVLGGASGKRTWGVLLTAGEREEQESR